MPVASAGQHHTGLVQPWATPYYKPPMSSRQPVVGNMIPFQSTQLPYSSLASSAMGIDFTDLPPAQGSMHVPVAPRFVHIAPVGQPHHVLGSTQQSAGPASGQVYTTSARRTATAIHASSNEDPYQGAVPLGVHATSNQGRAGAHGTETHRPARASNVRASNLPHPVGSSATNLPMVYWCPSPSSDVYPPDPEDLEELKHAKEMPCMEHRAVLFDMKGHLHECHPDTADKVRVFEARVCCAG